MWGTSFFLNEVKIDEKQHYDLNLMNGSVVFMLFKKMILGLAFPF